MDNQQQIMIPADYQQQVKRLSDAKQSLYVNIGGIKTLAFWSDSAKKWKPYVEVEERQRILYEKLKNKELQSFVMTESVGYEIGDKACWKVVIEIDGVQYIGSADIFWNSKAPCAIAETSAFGRALGHANLGTIEGLACSADEMQAAGFRSGPPRETRIIDEEPSPEIKAIMLQELEQKCVKLYGTGKFETVKSRLKITSSNAAMTMAELEQIDKALAAREKQVSKAKVAAAEEKADE